MVNIVKLVRVNIMSTWKLLRSFENLRKKILFEDYCLNLYLSKKRKAEDKT